jgi:hypothetical protein
MKVITSFLELLLNESTNPTFKPFDGNTKQLWWERFKDFTLVKISKGGSDRDVYDFGNTKMVLKVAKTARGLLQNDAEMDSYAAGSLLANYYEYGLNYAVVEKLDYSNKSTINKMLKELSEIKPLVLGKQINRLSNDDYNKVQTIISNISKKYNVSLEVLLEYDNVLWNDIFAPRNWAIGQNGRIVLADGASISSNWLTVDHETKQTWKSYLTSKREWDKTQNKGE